MLLKMFLHLVHYFVFDSVYTFFLFRFQSFFDSFLVFVFNLLFLPLICIYLCLFKCNFQKIRQLIWNLLLVILALANILINRIIAIDLLLINNFLLFEYTLLLLLTFRIIHFNRKAWFLFNKATLCIFIYTVRQINSILALESMLLGLCWHNLLGFLIIDRSCLCLEHHILLLSLTFKVQEILMSWLIFLDYGAWFCLLSSLMLLLMLPVRIYLMLGFNVRFVKCIFWWTSIVVFEVLLLLVIYELSHSSIFRLNGLIMDRWSCWRSLTCFNLTRWLSFSMPLFGIYISISIFILFTCIMARRVLRLVLCISNTARVLIYLCIDLSIFNSLAPLL